MWESAYCIGWVDVEGSNCRMGRLLLDIGPLSCHPSPSLNYWKQYIAFN